MPRKPRPCSACPLRSANGWCAHRAITMPPEAPSCEWGRRKMNAGHSTNKKRRRSADGETE